MQSPIQKIIKLISSKSRKTINCNELLSEIYNSGIIQEEESALNQAFNDGRFYKPHIQNQIKNYYKQKYNGKESES
jgi:hypothetical protein